MILDYISNEYLKRKQKNPAYSLRAFAKSLQISPGALSAILSKKRTLTYKAANQILRALNTDGAVRKEVLREVFEEKVEPGTYVQLREEDNDIVSDWQYYAILYALEMKGKNSLKQISKRLKIDIIEVRKRIDVLERKGLIRLAGSSYELVHKNLTTTHDVPSSAIRLAHKGWIEKSLIALENQSVDERDFSGITLSISTKNIPKAKSLIKNFRREISELLEKGTAEEVYRLNIQLFSLEK